MPENMQTPGAADTPGSGAWCAPPTGFTGAASGAPAIVGDTGPVASWLLSAVTTGQGRDSACADWQQSGIALLPTGRTYSAVRLSERLVHAAARLPVPGHFDPDAVHTSTYRRAAEHLRSVLDGPVIHDPARRRYYALVPTDAAWPLPVPDPDAEHIGPGGYIGVPRPSLAGYRGVVPAYWAVPPSDPGHLCTVAAVARLAADGRRESA